MTIDYTALKSQWANVPGKTVEDKLASLNAMTVTAPPPPPTPDPTIPWWQANNYPAPFNKNDLAAAGLI